MPHSVNVLGQPGAAPGQLSSVKPVGAGTRHGHRHPRLNTIRAPAKGSTDRPTPLARPARRRGARRPGGGEAGRRYGGRDGKCNEHAQDDTHALRRALQFVVPHVVHPLFFVVCASPCSTRLPPILTKVDAICIPDCARRSFRFGVRRSPEWSKLALQARSSASRKVRTYSLRATGPFSAASSAREPTTTPSVSSAAARASAGVEMPKPA